MLIIPDLLKAKISQDSKLTASIHASLAEFEPWLSYSGLPFFPEYTDHGPKHVEEVLRTAVSLIRDEAMPVVTATDAAILILAILLHDSAMHMTEDGFLDLISGRYPSDPTITGLLSDKPWPIIWEDYLTKARRFDARELYLLFGDHEPVERPAKDPQKWSRRARMLIGDFIRRHHHRIAHEIALWGVPGASSHRLQLQVDSELADLAGLVARSHGLAVRSCLPYLAEKYDLRQYRDVHAVFLMTLLRLADYLQVQAERAPGNLLRVRAIKSPLSAREWKTHVSVRDIRTTHEDPEAIFIDVRPEEVASFLRLSNLLADIQREFDSSWAVLGEVYGRWDQLKSLGLTLRRVRSNLENDEAFEKSLSYIPRAAAFEASSGDLIPLLVAPLYGNNPEIGVRELLQNSVDAVLERLEWEEQTGSMKNSLPTPHIEITLDISKEGAWLTVSDNGIGMTADVICSYFLRVGASFRRSDAWRSRFESGEGRSRILRSGRFGIGVLAAFLLGDEIEVTTRHLEVGEHEGISFKASPDTELIELQKRKFRVGTEIRIKLSPDAVASLQKNQVIWDWYCLDFPSVHRKMMPQNSILWQRWHLAGPADKLAKGWRRVQHPDFRDIQWSYRHEILVCNGIYIGNSSYFNRRCKEWGELELGVPGLSIFDADGKLPLSLQRRSIVDYVSFEDVLLKDIIYDFLAFVLGEAPDGGLIEAFEGWMRLLDYRGLRSPRQLPVFFQDDGFALATKWNVDQMTAKSALLLVATKGHLPVPSLPLGLRKSVMFLVPHDGSQARIRYFLETMIERKRAPVGSEGGLWEAIHKPWANRIIMSKYWANRLSQGPKHVRLPRHQLSNIESEFEGNGWVLWRHGSCSPEADDLIKLIKASEAGSEDLPFLAVEIYRGSEKVMGDSTRDSSIVGEVWKELVRRPMIPIYLRERHSELRATYDVIKKYMAD